MSKRTQKRGPGGELQRIEALEQRKLAEQDEYREIITRAEAASDAETVSIGIRELGWQGMLDLMSGLRFPPSQKDWKRWLGVDWCDVPKRRKLDALEDQELARSIYFYGEIAEHTERLKAMARFAQALGMVGKHALQVFNIWSLRAVHCELLPHARELERAEGYGAQSLETMLELIDLIGNTLCEGADEAATIVSSLERLMAEAEESV